MNYNIIRVKGYFFIHAVLYFDNYIWSTQSNLILFVIKNKLR